MAYGLRVKNAAGEIQIDSQYRNMKYDEGASGITITNNGSAPAVTNIDITDDAKVPLILFRPGTSKFVCILDYVQSGGTYNSFNMQTEYNTSDVIDWKCYRQTSTNSSGYGLRVKDASGNIVFHSADSYFKIKSVNSVNLGTPSLNSYPYSDVTHGSDSNPYYILNDCGVYVTAAVEHWVGFSVWTFALCRIGIKKLSSTSVRVGWFPFAVITIPGSPSGVNVGYNPTVKLIVCEI